MRDNALYYFTNLLDFASMYAELKSLGITFVSKNEQFDTSTAIGEAMLKIILVFAELERQMTAERVTAVMISRANSGQWNGGRVPYVYDYDKGSKTSQRVLPEDGEDAVGGSGHQSSPGPEGQL